MSATAAAFGVGRHRPEGTLCEAAPSATALEGDRPRLHITSELHCEAELRKVESLLQRGHVDVAYRRARALYDAEFELPPPLLARVQFALATACVALADGDGSSSGTSGGSSSIGGGVGGASAVGKLNVEKHARSRLAQAERLFGACAATLESSALAPVGSIAEPTLVPCLLNRGIALSRLGRFRAAVKVLERARAVCGGLLGGGAAILRGRVLLALAAATLGTATLSSGGGSPNAQADAETLYREALGAAEAEERSANGWSVNVLEQWQSGSGQPPFVRRPQPARAALAALLQARGEHFEAMKLLATQRAGLRAKVQREGPGSRAAAELSFVAGRLAISAYAVHKDSVASAALKEAARLTLLSPLQGGGGESRGTANEAVTEAWIDDAVGDDPLGHALELTKALRSRGVLDRARGSIHSGAPPPGSTSHSTMLSTWDLHGTTGGSALAEASHI